MTELTYTDDSDRIPEGAVALALGSNLGDRLARLREAIDGLDAGGVEIRRVSSVYDSESAGAEGPRFLNAVVLGHTALAPRALLDLAKGLEWEAGRRPAPRNAPRPLDIDIVFHGNEVVCLPALTIPHPAWRERGFVLVPLSEIAGRWRDPVSGDRVEEILESTSHLRDGVECVHPPAALIGPADA